MSAKHIIIDVTTVRFYRFGCALLLSIPQSVAQYVHRRLDLLETLEKKLVTSILGAGKRKRHILLTDPVVDGT